MVLLLVACYDVERRGLPLAEQSARRYWRGVEGGTVLSHNSSCLEENIRHGSAKAKLIVLINNSKNDNRRWERTQCVQRAALVGAQWIWAAREMRGVAPSSMILPGSVKP